MKNKIDNIKQLARKVKVTVVVTGISLFGLMSIQGVAYGANGIAAPFNKAAVVPYKPKPSSFQKPVKPSYKSATNIKKPFTAVTTGVKVKPINSRPLPTSTLPKKWLVPKAAPGGNPLPTAGGTKPPLVPRPKLGGNSSPPPKKTTPIFNKAAGVPPKSQKKTSFQKPTKQPSKSPSEIKKSFDKVSKLPLKPSVPNNKLNSHNNTASNVNSNKALRAKLSGLEKAQKTAAKTRVLADGRIRYYSKEVPARSKGSTRGASFVTEHNPKTGKTRQWMESYNHMGKVTRVHPKSVNGQTVKAQHYPPTGRELRKLKK